MKAVLVLCSLIVELEAFKSETAHRKGQSTKNQEP
jgi:hypothetical protein